MNTSATARRRAVVVVAALCAVASAGCPGTPTAPARFGHPQPKPLSVQREYEGTGPVRAAVTTGMVADLVRRVGGDRVSVSQLMTAGVDPHLYKATPGDMSELDRADIVFFSGLHLEGRLGEVFDGLAESKIVVPVAEYLPADRVIRADGGAYDPHAWTDVGLWAGCVDTVRDALCAFDPRHADGYRERAAAYRKELEALDGEARTLLADVPQERRVMVTAHDAFRYFGRAYGVEVRGVQGVSTESEAGVRDVNELIDFLVKRGVRAIFVESSVSERNVRAIIEGCGQRGHKLELGGELYSDACGPDGTPEATYTGMMRHNARTVAGALK